MPIHTFTTHSASNHGVLECWGLELEIQSFTKREPMSIQTFPNTQPQITVFLNAGVRSSIRENMEIAPNTFYNEPT